jgi:hypothetical protein
VKRRKPEDVLQEHLDERTFPDDPELASLARIADRLERGLDADAPEAYRERALFIQGVAARKPGFPWARLMVPAMAISMLVAFVAISRDARPGEALYGVRKALDKVGLAENPARTAGGVLNEASEKVIDAEVALDDERFSRARDIAKQALIDLDEAWILLQDGSGEFLETQTERYEDLLEDANDVLEESITIPDDLEEKREEARERREERREKAAERLEERSENTPREDGNDSGSGSGDGD